jgi:FixJ family two-component response regulator
MKNSGLTTSHSTIIHIIDDDEAIRRALARLVGSLGMEARTFRSPKEFLDQEELNDVQCMLLDVQLPGMSGLDLYERMVSGGRELPVIFITAHPDEISRSRARMLNAVAYLEKPFDEKQLLSAINKALSPPLPPKRSDLPARAGRKPELH